MRRYVTFETGDTGLHTGLKYAYKNMLTMGDPSRAKLFTKYLDSVKEVVESGRCVVTVHGTYKGQDISVLSTQMTPGSVSVTLPEAIEECNDNDDNHKAGHIRRLAEFPEKRRSGCYNCC